MYALKRYSYKNFEMTQEMMNVMGEELNLDVSHPAFTNSLMKKDGLYCIDRLSCLAFLYCCHPGTNQDVEDEFWQLINPEIEDQVPVENLFSILMKMVEICIHQR
jgi:hypothetical protein